MPMYNLIEYSDNYSDTSGNLWQFQRDDEKDKFTVSVYRKPTFSGGYTHFDSFLTSGNKTGLLHTLLYRFFRICSDWTKFH